MDEKNNQFKLLDEANKRFKNIVSDIQNPKKEKFKNLGNNVNQLSKMFKREIEKSKGQSVKYAKYKYGTIVMVNFNINVGDELCGNHFAIVLTNEDSPYSSMLTILPLSSKNKSNRMSLGELISGIIYNEIIKKSEEIDQKRESLDKELFKNRDSLVNILKKYDDNINYKDEKDLTPEKIDLVLKKVEGEDIKELCEIINECEKNLKTLEEIKNNINKMLKIIEVYSSKNRLTYAMIDQIQTISKFKILKPLNEFDPISQLIVDSNTILSIEKQFISRFFSKAQKIVDKNKKEC
ncbi:MAG: type II toxin-antitoxin system PemK/MazF family toxin [Anaeroplasma bactoclasticum]|nr:type II toxin-antitoxin system PemK/MazF family toxin [Anaeroplasma bactoclasticum]